MGVVRGVVSDAHLRLLPADARGGEAERLQPAVNWLHEGAAGQLPTGKKTIFFIFGIQPLMLLFRPIFP